MLQNALGLRHAAIPVRDLKRAVEFYVETLGFTPYLITDKDWAMVSLHGTTLSLVPYHEVRTSRPKSHPAHVGVTFATREGVDEFRKFLEPKQIPFLGKAEEHRDKSYGFYLKDPEDNYLELIFIPMDPVAAIKPRELVIVVIPSGDSVPIEKMLKVHFADRNVHVAKSEAISGLVGEWKTVRLIPLFLSTETLTRELKQKHPKTQFIVEKNLETEPLFYSLICESVGRLINK